MRRTTLVLGLISSATAVALIAYVYESRSPSNNVEPNGEAESEEIQAPSITTTINELGTVNGVQPSLGDNQMDTQSLPKSESVPNRKPIDEETARRKGREDAERSVNAMYGLILEKLGLTPSERDAMLSLLTEDKIAAKWTSYQRGKKTDKEEQANRIEAIIGYAKLQEFLAMERNLGAFGEVHMAGAGLQRNGTPFTAAQQDGFLKILTDVKDRQTIIMDAERGSMEQLEQRLAHMDEYDRLVMELVPSVLTSTQVEYLFEQYQRMSYERAAALESQIEARANDPSYKLGLSYPARRY